MAITDWNIAKSNHTCKLCDSKFKEGDQYFSVLFETESEANSGFDRHDYCPGCFEQHSPEHAFSFWKSCVPEGEDEANRKPVLDLESVMAFFRRLSGEKDQQKLSFRFVLALMLTRKKVLKLDGSGKSSETGEEVLIFKEPKGGDVHEVVQPPMNDDEIGSVSEELGKLLGIAPPPQTAENAQESTEAAQQSEGPVQEAQEVPGGIEINQAG